MTRQPRTIMLPDLKFYRQELIEKGALPPLNTVPFKHKGLLKDLPFPPEGKTGWPWMIESKTLPETMPGGSLWPKITIVTPSYNQGKFIEETIRSVLLQNYPNLEYIVFDAGSTDCSVEIICKYEKWLSFWSSEKDRGQAHAINKGLSISSGKFWQWINSDDVYFSDIFYKVALELAQEKYDTLYGSVFESTDDEVVAYQRTSFNVNPRMMLDPKSIFNKDYYYKPEATILSVSKSTEVGGFREDFHNLFDGEFMLRYVPESSPAYTNFILMRYRIHPQTKTIATARRMYEEYFNMLSEHHKPGSKNWFSYLQKKADFLSTRDQSLCKNKIDLLWLAAKLLVVSPYVFVSKAYWGLWKKVLLT